MTYGLQDEINVQQILSKKVSNDKYDVVEEYLHLRYHGFTKWFFGFFFHAIEENWDVTQQV